MPSHTQKEREKAAVRARAKAAGRSAKRGKPSDSKAPGGRFKRKSRFGGKRGP